MVEHSSFVSSFLPLGLHNYEYFWFIQTIVKLRIQNHFHRDEEVTNFFGHEH